MNWPTIHSTGVVAAVETVAAHAVARSRRHTEYRWTVGGMSRWRSFLRSHLSAGSSAAAIVVLDSLSNTTTVRSVTNGRNHWSHDVDQQALGLMVGIVQGSLNHIVGKAIVHHLLQLISVGQLHDQRATSLFTRSADAFLDNIGTELLARQWRDVTDESLAERLTKLRLSDIHDVLDDIVAKGILNQGVTMLRDGTNNLCALSTRSVVDTTLKNTAAMTVSTDNDNVVTDGVDDELNVFMLEVVETFLNNMVAVQILDKADNVTVESCRDHLDLDRTRDELDHLLKCTSAVLVESNLDHLRRRTLDESSALLVIGIFEELLAEVIAEGVYVLSVWSVAI